MFNAIRRVGFGLAATAAALAGEGSVTVINRAAFAVRLVPYLTMETLINNTFIMETAGLSEPLTITYRLDSPNPKRHLDLAPAGQVTVSLADGEETMGGLGFKVLTLPEGTEPARELGVVLCTVFRPGGQHGRVRSYLEPGLAGRFPSP
jgi:hypothetical protein